jgi:hypothetical protein
MIQVIFGMIPPIDFTDWYVGLWSDFEPTYYDLSYGEIVGTRTALSSANFSLIDTSTIQYDQWILFENLPQGYVAGWFVVNGLTEINCSWYQKFDIAITTMAGEP